MKPFKNMQATIINIEKISKPQQVLRTKTLKGKKITPIISVDYSLSNYYKSRLPKLGHH